MSGIKSFIILLVMVTSTKVRPALLSDGRFSTARDERTSRELLTVAVSAICTQCRAKL